MLSRIAAPAACALMLLGAEVPRPAPKITFPTVEGGAIDVSRHAGKVVCLEFILTTCSHCQETTGLLQKMQDEYGPRGFQALAVATNTMSHMLIPDFIKQFGVRFPVGYGPGEKAAEYLQHPPQQIMYYPQVLFIDKRGVIRAHFPGGDKFFEKANQEANMRANIEKLLKDAGGMVPSRTPGSVTNAAPSASKKKG